MGAGAMTQKSHLFNVFKTEHAFVWAFAIGVVVIFLVKLIAQGLPVLSLIHI